ncbi:MAG: FtsX-like permease family protein [Succinivibrio sp.]|jgi:lipoprotein-releasing system permease protein|nr:FtsX-like permease family protein [Succinivibrio sp.]
MKLFRPLCVSIAERYIFSGQRHRFASFTAALSVLGIAIGTAALITVSSVMQALQGRLSNTVLTYTPHITVKADPGAIPELLKLDHVTAAGPFASALTVAQTPKGIGLVTLMGMDPSATVLKNTDSDARLSLENVPPAGSYAFCPDSTFLSRFDLRPGDKVRLISTVNARYTPAGLTPVKRNFVISGYQPSLRDATALNAAGSLEDVRRLFRFKQEDLRVRLWLDDPFAAAETEKQLSSLGFAYEDWKKTQGEFFSSVATERLTMTFMLFLIVIVAAFNILSALAMIVSARTREIAVLKTLGMSSGGVLRIFTSEGLMLGLLGTIAGTAGGSLLAAHSNFLLRALGVPAGRSLEVGVQTSTVLTVALVSIALCVLCTVYPALRAARTDPVLSLQQE